MDDLESHLLSSKRVRGFLKNFSATQWPRVLKATLLVGIQTLELEQISHLSVIEIEEMGKKRLSYYDLVVEPPKTCKEQVEKKEEVKKEVQPELKQTPSQPDYKFQNNLTKP